VRYFADFLGEGKDISAITANDLRRFIVTLQECRRYRDHPYNSPRPEKLSPQSIETYCRGIRAFFGFLEREELINSSPMTRVMGDRVPEDMREDELTDYKMGLLIDLKGWLWRKRVQGRGEKGRAERARAKAEAEAQRPQQLEIGL